MTTDHRFGQNFATFETSSHVFAFRWTFRKKVPKSTSFRETGRKIIDFAKALQLFEQTTMFWHFHEVFSKNLPKVAHFVRKHEKSSIWSKLCNFGNKLPCLCISMNFSEKSCKKCLVSWKRTKNHRFCQNLQLFEKTTMFGVSMKFSAKSCKKCLVSSKSTKNHRFGQSFATFRANYHVLAFRWSFQEKYANSASFREKAREIINFNKTCNFFVRTTMSLHFDELFRKKLQKLPHFLKKHEKSSIWPKLCNFFEQTTMFWCFDELFSKRLQKVAQFVKKHEKSSIWPKLCNFSRKLPCLCISINFSEKGCKKCLIS